MACFNILHDKAAEKLVQELKCNGRTDLLNLGFPHPPPQTCKTILQALNTLMQQICIFHREK